MAIGYDYQKGTLVLRSGTQERDVMPFAVHEVVWMRGGYWAMVALPPDRIPATADENRWLAAVAALERAGDARSSRTAYTTFLGRWPENVNAAIGLANTHHALGELAEAETVLRKAAASAPDSVVVLNNLAQTLSDLGRDQEALPFAERAVAAGGPFVGSAQKTRDSIAARLRRKSWRGRATQAAAAAGSRAPRRPGASGSASATRIVPSTVTAANSPSPASPFCIGARLLQRFQRVGWPPPA